MMPTAKGSGAPAALSVVVRIITAAEGLRTRGAEPHVALAIVLREGEPSPDVEATARAIWTVGIGSDGTGPGGAAALETLSRILACADTLCSFGVEPCEAIDVLRWIDAPGDLERVARDAWTFVVGSGTVSRGSWSVASDESRPGAAAVIDALARVLTLAELLRTSGAKPRAVIDVLRWVDMPAGLMVVVRAAWAFAVGSDNDDEPGGRA